jgi:cytochrome c oxidase subunit 3
MIRTQFRHYFNDISYTSLPYLIGSFAFCFIFYFVIFVKKFVYVAPVLLLVVFACLIGSITEWLDDLLRESTLNGRYNRKIRAALVCGFTLFLVSEVMLFGGFFWAYFDRIFSPGYGLGSVYAPTGMENIDYYRWPLLGTFVLVTSGYFANQSYYSLRAGSIVHCLLAGAVTVVLALLFLLIQLIEYNGLNLTISDDVYASFFYLLTGFHGFHVLVGFLFLCEQYNRVCESFFRHRFLGKHPANLIFSRERHLGVAFAVIYWHFVDIIWLFLFVNVYVYNTDKLDDWLDSEVPELIQLKNGDLGMFIDFIDFTIKPITLIVHY